MKKGTILSICLLFSAKGFSQNLHLGDSKQWYNPKNKFLRDSLPRISKLPLLKSNDEIITVYKMPVVKPTLKSRYIMKNGAGANVNSILPYNMPAISPDSTFASNMPVALKNNNSIQDVIKILLKRQHVAE